MLDIALIRSELNTERIGRHLEHVESTRSTNDDAWERIGIGLTSAAKLSVVQPAGTGAPRTSMPGRRIAAETSVCARIPGCTDGHANIPLQADKADAAPSGNPAGDGNEVGVCPQCCTEFAMSVDGLAIFAEQQSAGRGRRGSRWESPRGASLLCSVAIVDQREEVCGAELSLLAAVAVRDAVASCTEIAPMIKWPNDLLVRGRKLGGVLVESRVYSGGVRAYVVGVGVNCLQQQGHIPAELANKATSLELESRCGVDRNAVAVAVLTELDRWLATPDAWTYETLRGEWLKRCEPMGGRVVLRRKGKEYSGSMLDIDPTAALVVQLDEGAIRAFNAADTRIVEHRGDCP